MNQKFLLRLLTIFVVTLMLAWPLARLDAQTDRSVVVLTADGELTPVMVAYIQRGIDTAEQQQAQALIVELNTPGGDVTLMDKIVNEILESKVPVIVYVSPTGGIAGSAGTVITLAAQANAMAPETSIGAASPIDSNGEDLNTTLATKIKNVLKAQVRNLASNRPQAAIDMAESAIENATAATADEAKAAGLTDFIATDLPDLLQQLDGYQVTVHDQPVVLHTAGASVVNLDINWLEQILALLTNPNIIFILLALGAQAILVEITHPGGWVPGFLGAVCLILAFYGLGVLPVNLFGLVFIGLAFALFILDIKATTHGVLTAAAVGCLIAGTLVLFNSPGSAPNLQVSVPLVLVTSLILGVLFFSLVIFAMRARSLPLMTGSQLMVGKVGVVRQALSPRGIVQMKGEEWTAETEGETLEPGQEVQVVAVQGVKLMVKKKSL